LASGVEFARYGYVFNGNCILRGCHAPPSYQIKDEGSIFESWKDAHFFQTPPDPRDYNPSLDTSFVQMIKKMMSKRPRDRYEAWDLVIQRLNSFIASNADEKQDIRMLLERAISTHTKREQSRLKNEEDVKYVEERNNLVEYRFQEIITGANQIIEAFNSESEFAKLRLTYKERPSHDLHRITDTILS
jgi:hypothetical protein